MKNRRHRRRHPPPPGPGCDRQRGTARHVGGSQRAPGS
jgi:hypothetical protein